MRLTIHPLTADRAADYFDFFDNVAFTDHPEWAWCYCTYYHLNREAEQALERQGNVPDSLRNKARTMIEEGALNGYLAYADGKVVGWCNCGDKPSFLRLRDQVGLWEEDEGRVLSIVCFTIAPDARRQGVATALLRRIVDDAGANGYDALEAYPANGEGNCFHHYHGYRAMFEAAGFAARREMDGYTALRLDLKAAGS